MQYLSRAAEPLLDLIFPRVCAGCEREGDYLCRECEGALPRLSGLRCRVCSKPGQLSVCAWCSAEHQPFNGITAPYRWTAAVQKLVYALKYRNVRSSAPRLSELMSRHFASTSIEADLITAVPLHARRERQRGYNQSRLLAEGVGREIGLPVESGMLRRMRNTPPQVSLESPEARRANVVDAFTCVGDPAGRKVLLVDDVVTTGATVSECASQLRAAGAASIWILALAR